MKKQSFKIIDVSQYHEEDSGSAERVQSDWDGRATLKKSHPESGQGLMGG